MGKMALGGRPVCWWTEFISASMVGERYTFSTASCTVSQYSSILVRKAKIGRPLHGGYQVANVHGVGAASRPRPYRWCAIALNRL